MVQGKVRVGPRLDGVSGVCVSNGREVVQTDADGAYRLPRQLEDRFTFVTVPAGYKAAGSFYADLKQADAFDFELREDPESRDPEFSFVQVTDIHMSLEGRAVTADLIADLAQIDREVGDRARFIVATGDLTNRGTQEEFEAYLQAVKTSRLPIYHCIGNHDDNDPEARGDHFMDALGPTYYTFDREPVHFVAYDGVGHEWRQPDHQAAWLRADLDLHRGRPVVFLVHFPWGASFYDSLREDGIIATLSGHWHCTRVYRNGETVHYNTPTLCFGGIDQSPRSYRLCTFRDGRLETEIRALESVRGFAGISFRPGPDKGVKKTGRSTARSRWGLAAVSRGREENRVGRIRSGTAPGAGMAGRYRGWPALRVSGGGTRPGRGRHATRGPPRQREPGDPGRTGWDAALVL